MRAGRLPLLALLSLGLFEPASAVFAITPENVLVLYNQASAEGLEIANHYALVHPGVQLLGLNGVSTSENITDVDYLTTILGPVRAALTPTTDVIVTTKGLPLKIQVTTPPPPSSWPNAPQYVDAFGVNRTIADWKQFSSLESELANIDRIGSTDPLLQTQSQYMMGDQSYTVGGHFASNPYFNSSASFSHAATGVRLTSRLDGFTVDDVNDSIDRAQHAFIGPQNNPVSPLHFLVDNDPSKSYSDVMANLVNNVLIPAGIPVTYDNTSGFVSSTNGQVMGYVSHGANQLSTPALVPGQGSYVVNINGLDINLADGAVFHTWESFNAETFTQGGNHGNQSLVGEWLAAGGTAATGNVAEPYASSFMATSSTVTNEGKMFQMLLSGKTWAEAAWSATRQLSYVNTVVGDPLMTWRTLLAGDANMDGTVDMTDLEVIGSHWGRSVSSGLYGWYAGDLNGDGIVNVVDLAIVGSTWGQVATWASGQPGGGEYFASGSELTMESIPEPSTSVLMALALACLMGHGFRRRRRACRVASLEVS